MEHAKKVCLKVAWIWARNYARKVTLNQKKGKQKVGRTTQQVDKISSRKQVRIYAEKHEIKQEGTRTNSELKSIKNCSRK